MTPSDLPSAKALGQQINNIGGQIRELEKLESEVAAARENMTAEQKKLANQIANKRVILGMDSELRSKIKNKLNEQVPKDQQEAKKEAVRKLQEELKNLQAKWPKLYGNRDLPDPCVPCLTAKLAGIKEKWETSYPKISEKAKKITEEVCSKLKEEAAKVEKGPLKNLMDKHRSIGVLENMDGSYTVAFSGQPGAEAIEIMKIMSKSFSGRDIKFVDFNHEDKRDRTEVKPNLTPTRERDEINPPKGSDAHPSEGRYCCERKIFEYARKNDIPVSGMYIQHCGGTKDRKNPFPIDGAEDPNQMSPCPSCKINHARITRGVHVG